MDKEDEACELELQQPKVRRTAASEGNSYTFTQLLAHVCLEPHPQCLVRHVPLLSSIQQLRSHQGSLLQGLGDAVINPPITTFRGEKLRRKQRIQTWRDEVICPRPHR